MTNIIFRKNNLGQITAVFLNDINHHSRLELVCYEHMGQHGGCDIGWLYSTKPAKPSEYRNLLNELVNNIGYKDLKIKTRLPSYQNTIAIIVKEQQELKKRLNGGEKL